MPDEEDRIPEDPVLSRLWEIAHKYQRSLTRGEVVPLGESEGDRRTVAPFAHRLHTTTERNLDGMTYRSLAEMQVRRDSRRLLSNLPGRLRLQRLGFEVALRAKPVVFLHAKASLRTHGLLASVGFEAETLETAPDAAHELNELAESENRVRMRPVDDAAIERLRGEVKARLIGQRLRAEELARTLTSNEADLLSQLARRGEVTLFAHADGSIEIVEGRAQRASTPTVAVALSPSRRRSRA